jgi:hypothetical protein
MTEWKHSVQIEMIKRPADEPVDLWHDGSGWNVNKPSERSEWFCYLYGSKPPLGLAWNPAKGDVPNWFWRKMQFLILGCRWVRKR